MKYESLEAYLRRIGAESRKDLGHQVVVEIVKARMEELRRYNKTEFTKADLVRLLGKRVKERTVYDFLDSSPLNSISLGFVLDALGLGIYPHEAVSQKIVDAQAKKVNDELAFKESLRAARRSKPPMPHNPADVFVGRKRRST